MGKYSRAAVKLLGLLERTSKTISKKYRRFMRDIDRLLEIDEKPHMAGMNGYSTIGLTEVAARKSMNGNINKELLNYVTNLKPSPTFFGELFYNVGTPELVAARFEYDPWQLYLLSRKQRDWLSMLQDASGSNISEAERLGIPKGERNFKPGWHVAKYPGYLLKGLMAGSPLEKQLSKNGTININQLNAYLNKSSQLEREVANKVLTELFAGLKFLDYNLFKKAVLNELIGNYNRNYDALSTIPGMTTEKMMVYGGDRLGIIKDIKDNHDGTGGLITTWTLELPVLFKQFTFETPKISIGNRKHYSGQPIGHSRTFTNQQEPLILHVMESLSDWAQAKVSNQTLQNEYNRVFLSVERSQNELNLAKRNFERGLYPNGNIIPKSDMEDVSRIINSMERDLTKKLSKLNDLDMALHSLVLESYLKLNYLQRQLQENLRYAAENGLTKMRYPTPETAAKIEGYKKIFRPNKKQLSEIGDQLNNMWAKYYNEHRSELIDVDILLIARQNIPGFAELIDLYDKLYSVPLQYLPAHQTILKKYEDFPKLFLKLYKDLQVRTVTDAKGNTWYEVDVPKGYLSSEWLFKDGGKPRIHIKPENRGKFTALKKRTGKSATWFKEHGTPALKKMATFALNSKHWNH